MFSAHRGRVPLRAPSLFFLYLFIACFSSFILFSFPFMMICLKMFQLLATPFSSMICVSTFIDFQMDFYIIVDVVLIPFPFAHATFWTIKNICFYNEFQWFYHSEKHDFWWFSWSFPLPVLVLIFDKFGIDFGSILGALLHQIPWCFGVIVFLMIFWTVLLSIVGQNWDPKAGAGVGCMPLFSHHFSSHLYLLLM